MVNSLRLKPYLYLAAIVGLLAGGFAGGYWVRDAAATHQVNALHAAATEAREKSLRRIQEQEAAFAVLEYKTAIQHAIRMKEREIVEDVSIKEELEYVQTTGSRRCAIDPGGVRILNIAAARGVPAAEAAATGPYGAAADVTAGALVSVTAANYRTCNRIADQLIGLQEWVAANYTARAQ